MWNQIADRVTSLLSRDSALLNFCVVCEFNEPRLFAKSVNEWDAKLYPITDKVVPGRLNVHPVLYTPDPSRGEESFAYLRRLPKSLLDDVRTDRGVLLLDASGSCESHNSEETASLTHELSTLGIPSEKTVVLAQNHAATRRKRAPGPIPLFPCNSKIMHFAQNARRRMGPSGEFRERLAAASRNLDKTTPRKKKFTFLDSPKRPEHTSMLLFLAARSLLQEGAILPHLLRSKAERRGKLSDLTYRHFPPLENLESYLPTIHALREASFQSQWQIQYREDGLADYVSPYHPLPPWLAGAYSDSFFSIVVEAKYAARADQALQESFLRPVVGLHPFVLLGFNGELSEIRNLGFETFSPCLDETYDATVAPMERTAAVLTLIERLCATSPDDWESMNRELFPRLKHNCEHLAGGFQQRYRDAIEKPILEHLQSIGELVSQK